MYKWIWLVLIVFCGCKKDNLDNGTYSMGYDYYPITPKREAVFRVDSIYYDGINNRTDTFTYEIKEYFDSFFLDNLSQNVARVVISCRKDSAQTWQAVKSIYIKIGQDYCERVEDNMRYLKLSFPLSMEKIWNLNERNTNKANYIFYTALHTPYQNNYLQTDSSIIVESESIHNLFQDFEYKEVYGKHIGLMYLRYLNKLTQQNKKTGYQVTYQLYYVK